MSSTAAVDCELPTATVFCSLERLVLRRDFDTRMRWNRELIALNRNCSRRRGVCRPRVMHIIADFLVRTATEEALILGSQVTVEAMLI